MKQKLAALLTVAALALCALPMAVSAEGNVAQIDGGTEYTTLQKAVDAVTDNTPTTITLLGDASGDGVIVPSDRNIIFDLGGHTYTVSGETVGSSGTETNGFQLLKDSTIVFKNGGIKSTSETCKMLIQNYSDLTLESVTLDGQQLVAGANSYVLSNNCGNTQILGTTSITAPTGGVAFDMYYWPKGGYHDGVTVTVNTTGTITGKIEYTRDETTTDQIAAEKNVLTIENINLEGTFDAQVANANITINNGTFSEAPNEEFFAPGKAPVLNESTGKHETQEKQVMATITNANGAATNYYDVAEAVAALAEGDTLDLQGNTYTVTSPWTIDKANVTIKNGTVQPDASFTRNGLDGSVITVTVNGVTLNGLNVSAGENLDATKYAVQFYQSTTGGKVTGCTIVNDGWAGILLNGKSEVTVDSTVFNLSDDCYAAIEMGNGATHQLADSPVLTVSGAVTVNNSNSDAGNRLIWADLSSEGAGTIPEGVTVTINGTVNGSSQLNADGTMKPAPQPEEPWTPTPTATPAPAPVLDSTPKTGAVSLVALPLAALALAGVGVALRKRR